MEKYIREMFETNGVSAHLDVCLLGDTNGSASFYVSEEFWSSSTIRRTRNDVRVEVPKRVLNEDIYRINPSFSIVDIEGGEYELFQYIDFHNIKKIAIELHSRVISERKTNEVLQLLHDADFVIDHELSTSRGEMFLMR